MDLEQFAAGISGALVGVIGWLLVGIYIQSRARKRQARESTRAVYFEMLGNHLAIYTALEYGVFGDLSRASYDRLLPDIALYLEVEDLQRLALAYLGHAGYHQVSLDTEIPAAIRREAITGLHQAHQVIIAAIRRSAFSRDELERLKRAGTPDQLEIVAAASNGR